MFLSSVPGFLNVSIGASNLNALAPVYSQCAAAITFTNGLRPFIEAGPSNSQPQFRYSYTISDGLTYTISAALLFTAASQFALSDGSIGSPYQVISTVTGVRNYTWTQTGQTPLIPCHRPEHAVWHARPALVRFLAAGLVARSLLHQHCALPVGPRGWSSTSARLLPLRGMAPGSGTQYSAPTCLSVTMRPWLS